MYIYFDKVWCSVLNSSMVIKSAIYGTHYRTWPLIG